jgi:hypothetical protein
LVGKDLVGAVFGGLHQGRGVIGDEAGKQLAGFGVRQGGIAADLGIAAIQHPSRRIGAVKSVAGWWRGADCRKKGR